MAGLDICRDGLDDCVTALAASLFHRLRPQLLCAPHLIYAESSPKSIAKNYLTALHAPQRPLAGNFENRLCRKTDVASIGSHFRSKKIIDWILSVLETSRE
jgi:hypothetical protein